MKEMSSDGEPMEDRSSPQNLDSGPSRHFGRPKINSLELTLTKERTYAGFSLLNIWNTTFKIQDDSSIGGAL